MAAAGADDDGRAGGLLLGRQVNGQARIVNVGYVLFELALFLDVLLFILFPLKSSSRCAVMQKLLRVCGLRSVASGPSYLFQLGFEPRNFFVRRLTCLIRR